MDDFYMSFVYEGLYETLVFKPTQEQRVEALAYALLVLDEKEINEESIKIKTAEVKEKDLINNEEEVFEDYDKECCLELMKDYLWRYV